MGEHVRATTEFSLKGLGIAQRGLALRRETNMRQHEVAGWPVLLHESDETTFGCRTGLAQQEYVVILKVGDTPAVFVRPVVTAAPGKRFQ